MDRTVVALFDDVDTAQRALEELLSNGFDRNDVSVVRTNAKGDYATGSTTDTGAATPAAQPRARALAPHSAASPAW